MLQHQVPSFCSSNITFQEFYLITNVYKSLQDKPLQPHYDKDTNMTDAFKYKC